MAHELDRNTVTGRLAYVGVGETPWHKEGFTLDTPPTFDEALRLAGADYHVDLEPIYISTAGYTKSQHDGTVSANYTKTPMGKAIVRTDRGTVLGIVGDDYRPIQNRDSFEVLTPLLDSGVASIETAGVLRDGADAWMLVRFAIQDPVVREVFADEVVPFAVVTTNHTGRRKVVVMETPIRVVCANTLAMAFARGGHVNAVGVSHRGDGGRARLIDTADRFFSGITERYVAIAEAFKVLKARVLTVEEFTKSVLDVALPFPTDEKAPRFLSSMDRALDRRDVVTKLWDAGKGHTGDHSAWEAWNGLIQAVDHDVDTFRVRESRVSSLLDGSLGTVKREVLDSLLAVCK